MRRSDTYEYTIFEHTVPQRIDPFRRVSLKTKRLHAWVHLARNPGGQPSFHDMRAYLESVADQRLESFGITRRYGTRNPFSFMELQDVQELANFFERKVSAYQIAVSGSVALHEEF